MPILAIEGFDGAGKTTVARAVAERLGGVVATDLPLDETWRERRHVVNAGQGVDARFEYFLALNKRYMKIARERSSEDSVAVLDSSVFRTIATHRVLGSQRAADYQPEPSTRPDCTVLLAVDESTRLARLHERDGDIVYSSHWDEKLHQRVEEVNEQYRQLGLPIVNANVGIEKVVEEVVGIYQQRGII